MTDMQSFQNHFLIAMPTLDDPYFSRSITYICEHNADGAMGIVINQPADHILADRFRHDPEPAVQPACLEAVISGKALIGTLA